MACSLTMNETLKRALVVIGWVSAVAGWVIYQQSTGLGTLGAAQSFIDVVRGQWWAIGAFIVVYAARPLVLFPASLMTIAGGLLFGPVVGVIASVVGANASAMVAYWLARSLGFERADDPETAGIIARWSQRMRRESFVTVMVMRFAFLPYDLVNYAAGLLRIDRVRSCWLRPLARSQAPFRSRWLAHRLSRSTPELQESIQSCWLPRLCSSS